MNIETILMGLLQGVTEFLPISSSGHLSMAKIVLGIQDMPLAFDLVLHVATLCAVLVYFARDMVSLLIEWLYGFVNPNARGWVGWRFGWAVVIGTLVTAPFGILLKPIEQSAAANPLWIGANFWITGILLLSTKFLTQSFLNIRIRDGLAVGLAQGIAVLPGISRSGSTIWAGLLRGISRDEAFRFSFLLSFPAIVGATCLEAREIGGLDAFISTLPDGWVAGVVVAFISGLISLSVLKRLVTSDRWWMFSVYCILLGTSSVAYSIMGV